MKRRSTAMLLALGLTMTAVLSTGCGGKTEPAAEETGEALAAAEVEGEAKNDEGDNALAPIEPAATEEQTEPAATEEQTEPAAAAEPAQAAAPASGKFHVELTEAGGFDVTNAYSISYDSLVRVEGEKAYFCSYDGKDVDSRALLNMDYLGWGLYSVTLEGDTVNTTGLVSADGKVIIPFEAAIIEWPREVPAKEQPRYILVMVGTETTENQDEALFFVTDRQFAIMANEDDTYFKGTLKVFDLVEGKYVEGLEFSRGTDSSFAQVGQNIMTDLTEQDTLYKPDGSVAYTAQSYIYYTKDYMLDRVDSQCVILDSEGKELRRTDDNISVLSYQSPYFMKYADSKYSVVDVNGNTVLPTPWSYIYEESAGRFRVKNDSDTAYSLIASDGSVIAASEDLYGADSLGFYVYGSSDNYSLITPDNRLYEGLSGDTEDLFFDKDDTSFLVLNTGEFAAMPGGDADDIGKGIFTVENDSRQYALYDTFTGKELLGFEYDQIDDVNDDYIYAIKGGKATIYKGTIVAE